MTCIRQLALIMGGGIERPLQSYNVFLLWKKCISTLHLVFLLCSQVSIWLFVKSTLEVPIIGQCCIVNDGQYPREVLGLPLSNLLWRFLSEQMLYCISTLEVFSTLECRVERHYMSQEHVEIINFFNYFLEAVPEKKIISESWTSVRGVYAPFKVPLSPCSFKLFPLCFLLPFFLAPFLYFNAPCCFFIFLLAPWFFSIALCSFF